MPFDMLVVREKLAAFDLKNLFVDGLGWNLPKGLQTIPVTLEGEVFHAQPVAQLGGVVVFTVTASQAGIPDADRRKAIYREIAQHYHENLLIFLDRSQNPTQSLWYWVKREGGKSYPREHLYVVGQSGDLILSKIRAMFVDLSDLNANGDIAVAEATRRVRQALDVEAVTKKFYVAFQEQHLAFLQLIGGIGDERDRRWYASVLLNRLMFIYFLQRKGFLNDNREAGLYLQKQLAASQGRGPDRYYREFLQALFFEGFAKPAAARDPQATLLVGNIPYLNGGLFLPHPIEIRWKAITIPDSAFVNLLGLFEHFSWNLDDTPGGRDNELNPNVLGYIFEKYINQKAFGAYYTRPEITEYLCEQTIHKLILQAVNTPPGTPAAPGIRIYAFDSVADLLLHLDVPLCRLLKEQVLPQLRLLDPACGSGAFLVAAMKTLVDVYASVIGHIDALNAPDLKAWINGIRQAHPNPYYYIKNRIITQNLFGVDWMEEATEIAKLRLFLALVASAQTVGELEPLPNIDFNILAGDSLIGLLRVEPQQIAAQGGPQQQSTMFQNLYTQQLAEKNRLLAAYRDAASYTSDLQALRDSIQQHRDAAWATLDGILLNEFGKLGIRYEEATWDTSKSAEGPVRKRPLTEADIQALRPFHWGYEFDEVLTAGGFDAIITNPPWDILKPNAKEFFAEHSTLISKKKMRIEEFESAQAKLLTDPEIRAAWLAYESRFPYVSAYFRSAAGYANQISLVNGKKAGTDINLYKLFVEQCYNLLRPGGQCGIVIPSGIYTDLGTKQLREMLFSATEITGLFGFENRREIFEGVHRSFKFVVLTFEKGGQTSRFPAAFMP